MVIVKEAEAVFRVWGLVVDFVSRTSTVKLDVALRLVGMPVIAPVPLSSSTRLAFSSPICRRSPPATVPLVLPRACPTQMEQTTVIGPEKVPIDQVIHVPVGVHQF